MGVEISVFKIKERLSDRIDSETLRDISDRYSCEDGRVSIVSCGTDGDLLKPFDEGVYLLSNESENYLHMSYSGYADFRSTLEKVGEECEGTMGFRTTLRSSGIDNCISYVTAGEMLSELESHREAFESYFKSESSYDDLAEFMVECYDMYIGVARDCVEKKGIICYH